MSTILHSWRRVLRLSLLLGVIALPFGTVYALLLWVFTDAIECYNTMLDYTASSFWGGIHTLFSLNSGVFGWVSVVVLEGRLGATGIVLILICTSWCVASILASFALAALFLGRWCEGMLDMLVVSTLFALGAGTVRAYLGDIL